MGYFYALRNWLMTEKTRHDLMDYLRAALIMAAVMAMVRIVWDMVSSR